jgi:excisionase family DNA binding protein
MMDSSPLAFGIAEACAIARIGRTTLYAAIRGGELRARKIGKRTLILQQDFLEWLNSRPIAGSVDSSTPKGESDA